MEKIENTENIVTIEEPKEEPKPELKPQPQIPQQVPANTNNEALPALINLISGLVTQMATLSSEVAKMKTQAPVVQAVATKSSGLFGGGPKVRKPILDSDTGEVFPSKISCGYTFALEVPSANDPANHFAWYRILGKYPGRFVEITQEQYDEALAAKKAAKVV